jgi:hypothetical protein
LQIFQIIVCLKIEQTIVYSSTPLLGADEVSGEWWQLVTGIDDEADGLVLCEWHPQSYD